MCVCVCVCVCVHFALYFIVARFTLKVRFSEVEFFHHWRRLSLLTYCFDWTAFPIIKIIHQASTSVSQSVSRSVGQSVNKLNLANTETSLAFITSYDCRFFLTTIIHFDNFQYAIMYSICNATYVIYMSSLCSLSLLHTFIDLCTHTHTEPVSQSVSQSWGNSW